MSIGDHPKPTNGGLINWTDTYCRTALIQFAKKCQLLVNKKRESLYEKYVIIIIILIIKNEIKKYLLFLFQKEERFER